MDSEVEGEPVISGTAKCDRLPPRDLQPGNEAALISRGSENKEVSSASDSVGGGLQPSAGDMRPSEGTPSVNPRSTNLIFYGIREHDSGETTVNTQ
jgi:hypothetical protein